MSHVEKVIRIFHFISFVKYPILLLGLFFVYRPILSEASDLFVDFNTGSSKTIYVLELEDSDIDAVSYETYLQDFFNIVECDGVGLTPEIIVTDHVDPCDLTDTDALSILSYSKSAIIALTVGTYCDHISHNFEPHPRHTRSMTNFLQSNVPEFADAGSYANGLLSFVHLGSIDGDALTAFNAMDVEHLTAFFTFHGTGHNAGIVHGGNPEGFGFMHISPSTLIGPNTFATIEDLVDEINTPSSSSNIVNKDVFCTRWK